MAYKNYKDQHEYRKKWLKTESRPKAKCHPDKPHRARGMCDKCYDNWLYENSPKYRASRLSGAKKWKSNNKEKVKKLARNSKLIYKYGITETDYQEMLKIQKGKCKICGLKPKLGKILHVDHCHNTGNIRGLLCLRWNGSLSWIEDIIKKSKSKWFLNALKYLNHEFNTEKDTKTKG